MAGTIGDVGDEFAERRNPIGLRRDSLVQNIADGMDDLDILTFAVPPDIVGLGNLALGGNSDECAGMILDVEPVANLFPVAIDGQGFALESIQYHEGDELLRKVIGAVVV